MSFYFNNFMSFSSKKKLNLYSLYDYISTQSKFDKAVVIIISMIIQIFKKILNL